MQIQIVSDQPVSPEELIDGLKTLAAAIESRVEAEKEARETMNSYLADAESMQQEVNNTVEPEEQVDPSEYIEVHLPSGYETLMHVLLAALEQASKGKGAERHANELPFHFQPMQTIADQTGPEFLSGQAIKKIQESQGLPTHDRKVRELLGAINYIAGLIIWLDRRVDPTEQCSACF